MVKVNKEKCVGCGLCISICPEVFELDENGKSTIKKEMKENKEVPPCVKEAIKSCPAQAIEE